MTLLNEGQVIRGTYEVERYLGEGAFAEVYRVNHRFLGKQAMKVFKWIGMTIAETEQVLGEAILLSRLGHPNIVRVFDANVTETSRGMCGYFTMEYIAGGSLHQFWRSHGPRFVPVETTIDLIRQVCRGLTIAHAETPPIIHRDIKPQNILVGYDANGLRALLSDFGLAKRVNPMTLLASAKGTRCFKPPEALKDLKIDSCSADVWAMGMTLYLLLADRLPFYEAAELDLFDLSCLDRPLIPPSRYNIQVDSLLDKIVYKALAQKAKDRYPNAKDLLADLDKWKPSPAGAAAAKPDPPTQVTKSFLGDNSPANESDAKRMAAAAIVLSRQIARLPEAADLMEEAFNKWPTLRETHEYSVKLWRRGIAM
jgi:eukaryotic-like serine/threonine-protein kinase